MTSIYSRYANNVGGIVAIKMLSPAEIDFEVKELRREILRKFHEDCVFQFQTTYGPDATVTIRVGEVKEPGKAKQSSLIINPIRHPSGLLLPPMPTGINWRWSALHDLWNAVNIQRHPTPDIEKIAADEINRIMYGDKAKPSFDGDSAVNPFAGLAAHYLPTYDHNTAVNNLGYATPGQHRSSRDIFTNNSMSYTPIPQVSVPTRAAEREISQDKTLWSKVKKFFRLGGK